LWRGFFDLRLEDVPAAKSSAGKKLLGASKKQVPHHRFAAVRNDILGWI
jgi:hypothetical protein